MIALALLLAATSFRPNAPIPRPSNVSILYDRTFATATSALPTCDAAHRCVMQCKVSSGTTWACVDGAGATITVTAGTSPIAYTSPYGRIALDDLTAARAPQLATGTAMDAIAGAQHTIVITGYATQNTSTTDTAIEMVAGANAVQIRDETATGSLACNYGTKAARPNASARAGPVSGWEMFGCRYDGQVQIVSRAMTATQQVAATSGAYATPTSTAFWFGRNNGGTSAWRGPFESVTIYAVRLGDDDLQAMEHAWSQIPDNAGSPILFVRDSTSWAVVGGRVEPYGIGTPYVTTRGLEFQPNSGDNAPAASGWATDATDASSWTAIGSPTTTTNQAAGPFASWKVGTGNSEADLIVDDDAGADEGYMGPLDGADDVTLSDTYTASCYVRSGTSGTTTTKVRLGVLADLAATGDGECTAVTTLTATFTRVTCTKTISGVRTHVQGEVLVGSTAAETGSIIVSQCQLEPRPYASDPKPDNVAVNAPTWTIPETETDTWPSGIGTGADIEVVFQLNYNFPSQEDHIEHLLDVVNDAGTDHSNFIVIGNTGAVGTQANLRVNLTTADFACTDPDDTATDSSNLGLVSSIVANTWYAARFKYMPRGTVGGIPRVTHELFFDGCGSAPSTCHASTLVASNMTGSRCAGDGKTDIGYLGQRFNSIRFMDGAIYRVTVKAVTP